MEKDVIVTISGLHIVEDGVSSPVDLVAPGEYYCKNGRHFIFYDEVLEAFGGVCRNRVIADENVMEIYKTGVTRVHMVFEKDKKNIASYQTPCGNFLMGVCAGSLQIRQEEDLLDIDLRYDLEINYEHLAECSLTLRVRPRETDSFLLDA